MIIFDFTYFKTKKTNDNQTADVNLAIIIYKKII